MTTSPSAGPSLAACTIVAHNYLPMARVLARSFLKWHPEASFSVIVIDHPLEARGLVDEPFTVVPITELDFGDEGFENMATIYDVTEFATSVKPFALQHLLRSAECAFYIDPDIEVYERLDPLVDATMQAGITLTPHCLSPIAHDGAGRPDLRFHDLRHTGAVLAAQSGATLAELMHRLGHTTPAAAMRYQHAATERDREIAHRMSQRYREYQQARPSGQP